MRSAASPPIDSINTESALMPLRRRLLSNIQVARPVLTSDSIRFSRKYRAVSDVKNELIDDVYQAQLTALSLCNLDCFVKPAVEVSLPSTGTRILLYMNRSRLI